MTQNDQIFSEYSLSIIVSLPFQFQNQRFEMVIVMPEATVGPVYKGLLFFEDSARKGLNDPESENIYRAALDALEPERQNKKEYTITLPPFTVDSNIDVKKYLRAVREHSITK